MFGRRGDPFEVFTDVVNGCLCDPPDSTVVVFDVAGVVLGADALERAAAVWASRRRGDRLEVDVPAKVAGALAAVLSVKDLAGPPRPGVVFVELGGAAQFP